MAQVELILLTEETMDWDNSATEVVQITTLLGGYAIAVLEETKVEEFLQTPGILYAEFSVRVYTSAEFGRAASCINNRPSAPYELDRLSGEGVLVGIIDSGIDYTHPDFRKEDGTTRIVALWDQSLESDNPPMGYPLGTLFTQEQINAALQEPLRENQRRMIPSIDLSGHGTHVAGIAAGNGRALGGKYRGVAYESELLIVKLKEVRGSVVSISGTARLMEAVDFCIRFALENNQPLALNLSYGTQEGAHNGRSLLETYLNTVSQMVKGNICVGTGNDGVGRNHAGGVLTEDNPVEIELAVEGEEKSLELEVWKNYPDHFFVQLEAPTGQTTEFRFGEGEEVTAFGSAFLFSGTGKKVSLGGTEVEGIWSTPTIYQNLSQLRIGITAKGERIGVGLWKIRLIPERIVEGTYDIWILRGVENSRSGFVKPDSSRTLTIPSTAEQVISVGAYDFGNYQTAPFSGRGPAREAGRMKPDLVAPGVGIVSCAPGGGYTTLSGTSMETPFVTGSVALLLQWGLRNGNATFLYGEKLRAYLLDGAQRTAGEIYPDPVNGWGRLCVNGSIP